MPEDESSGSVVHLPIVICALHISNFRSLGEDVSIVCPDTPPYLVALAGPNAAGKSNVIDAFRFLREAVAPRGLVLAVQKRGGFSSLLRHGADRVHLVVEAVFDADWVVWGLELAPVHGQDFTITDEALFVNRLSDRPAFHASARRRIDPAHDDHIPGFGRALLTGLAGHAEHDRYTMRLRAGEEPNPTRSPSHDLQVTLGARIDSARGSPEDKLCALFEMIAAHLFYPENLRQPQLNSTELLLQDHGENWTSVLQRQLPEYRNDLFAGLSALVPDLADVRVDAAGDHLVAVFEHRNEEGESLWIPANRESDGTLRTAAMLTALLQDPPPSLIAIEEPELAVHVRALAVLRDYLLPRAQSTPVLLSTHSAELLELLPLECLRVVERRSAGTSVSELSSRQRSLVLDGVFTLGQLILAQALEGEPRE